MSPTPPIPTNDDLSWLTGGGEMGALIRSMDWAATPLGPLRDWPQSLRTSVSLCLSSTFPILVAWGPDDIQIYNDAYRPICGGLHPRAMGGAFKEIWASALPVVGDAFDRAHQGEGAYIKDQRMFLDRHGYLEEAFMTFSFSPIRVESGEVGGIFHPITEATAAVLNARRSQELRDLNGAIADARVIADVGRDLESQYQAMALDLPFVLLYQIDPASGKLQRRASAGLDRHPALAPQELDADDAIWPFAAAAASRAACRIDGLAARFGAVQCGPYENAPDAALVLPITVPGQHELFGFVVAGVSAARAIDADYLNFYDMLGAAVNTAVGNVIAYEKEQRRAEELAQIDRAKTAFFSNVSHEFRTPLTLILGPLDDALADAAEPLGPVQRRRIDVTHRNSLRLLKLVNSLLDFSRIEAGRVQASYAPLDLAQLTLDLTAVFESAMHKGGLDYRVDLQRLPQPVYVDRDMWEKIVFNLLSNAFKFTLHGAVTVTLAPHEGMARLSVLDTGSGIPAAELPRVFERFHRIEGTPGRTYEGTGIGLALIQELVKLHGGSIAVHSVEGEGTRFDVDLPFGHAHLAPERVLQPAMEENRQDDDKESAGRMGAAFVEEALRWLPDQAAPAAAQAGIDSVLLAAAAPLRILIADDNNDMRAYLKTLLEPHAQVTVCADGEAAWDCLQTTPVDLLLSDVMMPRLDGFALIARIRADQALRQLPVMLLSARAGEEAKIEGLQAGADDYLVKPFAANELLARVRRQAALGEERRLQQRVADALAEKNRMQSEFLFTLAHELRNPLAPIRTGLDLMRLRPGLPNTEVQAMMRRQVDHMVHLVDDLLDMARLSEGKVELRREQVALAQIVDDAIEISMPLIDAGRHTIELRLPAAPVTLYVDRHRIAQVLSNLVNNAAKYTPAGGHLTLSARLDDGALVLAVGDNGIGIDAAMLPLVFDMYAQAHRHEGLGQGGLGVGLNLVRKLVELHGGSVAVHSEGAGQGSCFTVSLPPGAVIDGHDAADAAVAPPALAQRETGGGLRVLVVDDNRDAAEMLGALLEMRGHAVRIVHDGAACLRAAAAFLPQLVFLDIGLPDRSGFEVAPDLRRLAGMADVTLIALTGWGAEEDRRRSGSAGFDGHLTKPADLASVEAVLREVTAGGRPQSAPAAAGRHTHGS